MSEDKPWVGKSVLVVDDSKLMCEQISQLFRDIGMEVIDTCHNGKDALAQIEARSPELVSLDIIMPVMHGLECYQELQKKKPDQKVIFVSCLADSDDIKESYENISRHLFIAKPLTKDGLLFSLSKIYGVEYHPPEEEVQTDPEAPVDGSANEDELVK